jgi:hypothetical protein
MNETFIPDAPITKKRLASFLGVSERSIFNYQLLASQYVDDFLSDYPSVCGKYITAAPLTAYQAWVLCNVHKFLEYFACKRVLTDRLENDPQIQQSWGKQAFIAKYPEYSNDSCNSLVRLQK